MASGRIRLSLKRRSFEATNVFGKRRNRQELWIGKNFSDWSGWKCAQPGTRMLNRSALNCIHMRVLGIDCGGEYTGYGVVEMGGAGELVCLTCGAIRLSPREPLARRLARIYEELGTLIGKHQPDEVAIEGIFYALNVKSALKLGQVRGVAMLAAAAAGLEVAEYSPLTIKSSVVGYGRAEKEQVQHMVTRLLRLAEPPEPMDASDALAIAICHLHTAGTLQRMKVGAR
jgi:crossover junction endodeoxyribonuclease RuvC